MKQYYKTDCVCYRKENGVNTCTGYIVPDCGDCTGYKNRDMWIAGQVKTINRLISIGRPISRSYKSFLSEYSEYSQEVDSLRFTVDLLDKAEEINRYSKLEQKAS